MTETTVPQRLYGLRFEISRSIRYHQRRRTFFDRFNDCSSVVALIFGSAAIFALLGTFDLSAAVKAIPAVVVTLFSSVNLVIGSSRMARLHHDLARAFIDLEAKIALIVDPDERCMGELEAARLSVERDEPPVLRVLDSICYNETLRAFGHPVSECVYIAWYQRLAAPFFDFQEHTIRAA